MKGIMIVIAPIGIIVAGLMARLLIAWLLAAGFKFLMAILIMVCANIYGAWELGALVVLALGGVAFLTMAVKSMFVAHWAVKEVVVVTTGKTEKQHFGNVMSFFKSEEK